MRSIVTGGAGFIGSHVVDKLINLGHDVLVLDDLSGGKIENINETASFEQMSICDKYGILDMFNKFKPDYVYHLAAYAAEGLSHHVPSFNYENNLCGTANVVNATHLARSKHFTFTSSIAVYGHPKTRIPFTEDIQPSPCDPYGNAKLACENHIKIFKDYYRTFDYSIFRPHNVYGERQNILDPYRNVIGIFINKLLNNEKLPIFGDGSQTRSFSYIDLVAKCIALAPFNFLAKNKTMNIGSDEVYSINDLVTILSRAIEKAPSTVNLPPRDEVVHAHCNHSLARGIFKNEYIIHSEGLDEGLSKMAKSYTKNSLGLKTKCPSQIEIMDNLPESWVENVK